ncbi:hypothetical protein [Staphylococcus epidermidis]|uniref:hypothetical protein n=1 Tax=Staphylococcus epidermidis TaxID=1282 RepID=UPI00119DA40A|nr:hypothetical protein [Staphylococcus epidermidis]
MGIVGKRGKGRGWEVVNWGKWMGKKDKGVDIEGRYGLECWDLGKYILEGYWDLRRWGNGKGMGKGSEYGNR